MSEPVEGGRRRRASSGGVFGECAKPMKYSDKTFQRASEMKDREEREFAEENPGSLTAVARARRQAVLKGHPLLTAKAGRRRRGKKGGKSRRHRR